MSFRDRFVQFFGESIPETSGKIICQFHDDTDASLHLNYDDGSWKCFGCQKSGHIDDLVDSTPTISEETVEAFHKALLASPLLDWLKQTKGYNDDTVKRLLLGHNGSRFTYPVRDENGMVINLRLYSPTSKPKMLNYGKGYGKTAFYPFPPKEDEIYLCEGESDTTLARQMGLAAYCTTSGAGGWSDQQTSAVAGKSVVLLYDADGAGRLGATKVSNAIKFAVRCLRNVLVPVNVGKKSKDLSDYFLRDGGTVADLMDAVANTAPHLATRSTVKIENAVRAPLTQVYASSWAFKPVEVDTTVAGRDRAPYIIPAQVRIECAVNQKVRCSQCANASGSRDYSIGWEDGKILQLVDVDDSGRTAAIRKILEISCQNIRISVLEYQDIERLALIPYRNWYELNEGAETPDQSLRGAFHLGVGIKTNTAYKLKGCLVPSPRDQGGVLLVVEADPILPTAAEIDMTKCEVFRVHDESKVCEGENRIAEPCERRIP